MNHSKSYPKMLEQTPENRRITAERTVAFLKKSKIWEVFRDPVRLKEWIANSEPKEVEQLLERLNGIMVGTPIKEREIYTFSNQILHPETKDPVYQPPESDVQLQILKDIVLPSLKKMDGKDAAAFAATSVNMLHMFQDGNGRLARLVYWMLDASKSEKTEDDLLNELTRIIEKREGNTDFNPGIIIRYLDGKAWSFTHSKYKDALNYGDVLNLDSNLFSEEMLRENINSEKVRAWAFLSYFQSDPIMYTWAIREYVFSKPIEKIREYMRKTDLGNAAFDINLIVEDIVRDPSVLSDLLGNVERFKYIRFRVLAEIYLSPEKHTDNISGATIKDKFEEYARELGEIS